MLRKITTDFTFSTSASSIHSHSFTKHRSSAPSNSSYLISGIRWHHFEFHLDSPTTSGPPVSTRPIFSNPLLPIPYFLNTPADQLKSASTAHSITMTEFYDSATHTTLSTFSSLCYPTPTLTYLLPTFLPYTYLLIFLQRYQPCYPRCYHQSVQLSCKLFAASVQPSN